MKDLLKKFENKTPEIVFEWNDSETEAQGWLVISTQRDTSAVRNGWCVQKLQR